MFLCQIIFKFYLYDVILSFNSQHLCGAVFKILIHCGSGNGRTSVVVASLLLIMEYKSNPTQFKIKNKQKDNIHVITSSYDEKTRECPISIKEIINKLRHDFNPKAIETLGNVDTLIELCRHLLTEKNIFDQ